MNKRLPRGLCVRSVSFEPVEHGDGHTLEGYAALFDTPTEINSWEGHFHERIAPGAFKKTLAERPPIMQFDHGHDVRVGSVPIAAVHEVREDGRKGVFVRARMFDNPVVEPVRQAIEAGAIHGMSFRFKPVRDEWRDAKGNPVSADELPDLLYGGRRADPERVPLQRTIRELQCFEMGPVVNPQYEGTSVGVRSADDLTEEDREALFEEYRSTMVELERSDETGVEERAMGMGDASGGYAVGGDSGSAGTQQTSQTVGAKTQPKKKPKVEDDDEEGAPALEEKSSKPKDDEDDGDGKDDEEKSADPKKPYGDVDYADPGYQSDGVHRYPLDTKEHTDAAWKYINKQSNADKYTPDQVSKIKSKIKAAAEKFGIEISESKSDDGAAPERGTSPDDGAPATSTTPEDAAQQGTSDRENPKDETRKAVTVKTKEELEARRAEIEERLAKIAEENSERSLDTELQQEWDGLEAERAQVDKDLEGIAKRQAVVLKLHEQTGGAERGDQRQAPYFKKDVDPYDLDELRSRALSAEDYERGIMDNAHRAIERAKFAKAPDTYRSDSSGDRLTNLLTDGAGVDFHADMLAKRMLLTGSEAYERAFGKVLMHGNDAFCTPEERQALVRAKMGLSERAMNLNVDSGAGGGYAVPFQLDPTVILTNAGVVNPIRQLARIEQITGKQWNGVTSAGVTVTRGTEGSTAADNSFTLAQPTVQTYRVQGFVPFNIEIDLAWGALRSEITKLLIDGKEREEDSFITGNGSAPNPGGVLATQNTSQKVNTATVGSFSTQDVYALQAALAPRWEPNSSWLGHKAIYHRLRQFDTAGGAALWARIGDGQPPRLLDYPDYRSSAMSSTANSGDKILLYGDFKQFMIVDRIGMNVELVPQLFDPANGNRPTGQRGVYAIWMNNSVILVPTAFQYLQVQ